MPLYVLRTHIHHEHRMEFLPTPLEQTAQEYLSDFWRTSWPSPETRNLVFFMLTQSLLFFMPAFHTLSLQIQSWVPTNEHQVISVEKIRTEPWCTQTPTSNCTDHWLAPTAHSSSPRLLKAHHRTSLGHNYANPVYGVATICHQVRCLRWGHPSLFHTATSLQFNIKCSAWQIYHTDLYGWNL